MITKKARFVLIAALTLLVTAGLFAQEAASVRSWYVSAKGSDDNNGRTPETAFATFGKAFTSAAGSPVKTVTVVGALQGLDRRYSGNFPNDGSGAAEILLTGMDENAVVNCYIGLGGGKPSKIRIEKLRFAIADFEGRIGVVGDTTLVIGKDTVFEYDQYHESTTLEIEGGTVVMEANAVIRGIKGREDRVGGYGVKVEDGTFTMKDDSAISGLHGVGVTVKGGGSFTLQNNAKITNCGGRGVVLSANTPLSFTMKDNAAISGNGGGLSIGAKQGSVIIQDNASITNNITTGDYGRVLGISGGSGGGINISEGEVLIKGNVVISGNKAKQGGGIYFSGYVDDGYFAITGGTAKQPLIQKGKATNLIIQDKVQITGNEAQEGGGIYAKQGGAFYTVSFTAIYDHYEENSGIYSDIVATSIKPLTYVYTGITLKGGTISGNKADYGAGVYVEQAFQVEIEKSDNSPPAYGRKDVQGFRTRIRGTGQKSTVPAFTLAGGSITGNTAQFVGGGVYTKAAAAFKKGAGTISGNTAGDGEGEDLYTP